MTTHAWEPSAVCDTAARRLMNRFDAIPSDTVERCVRSAWVCALHVGAKVDVWLVEAIAEELLQALPVTADTAPTEATPGAAG